MNSVRIMYTHIYFVFSLLIPRKREYRIIPTRYMRNRDAFNVVNAPNAVNINTKKIFV